ncbi:uncharacterized protein [Pleurodeles waltl]|uniref:uncharacterized protein n=1 Tax=Pleurodeles waltl TaxID=8319 RepID=UPI003709709E
MACNSNKDSPVSLHRWAPLRFLLLRTCPREEQEEKEEEVEDDETSTCLRFECKEGEKKQNTLTRTPQPQHQLPHDVASTKHKPGSKGRELPLLEPAPATLSRTQNPPRGLLAKLQDNALFRDQAPEQKRTVIQLSHRQAEGSHHAARAPQEQPILITPSWTEKKNRRNAEILTWWHFRISILCDRRDVPLHCDVVEHAAGHGDLTHLPGRKCLTVAPRMFCNGGGMRKEGGDFCDSAYALRPWILTPYLIPANQNERCYNIGHR